MHEYVGNMHIHTPYSDGAEYHDFVVDAARRAKLDFIIVTDHNMLVQGIEGYYGDSDAGYVLLLTGEEVHDRTLQPQSNHCLVYNVPHEVSRYAHDPQGLIDHVRTNGGMTFLAHPTDVGVPWLPPLHDGGMAIAWQSWNIHGFTGLEIWNYMSDFKQYLQLSPRGIYRFLNPDDAAVGPRPETLALWDQCLAAGQRVTGIGNSDAHGTLFRMGPFRYRVFPYDFLFGCVNTHLLTQAALTGNVGHDKLQLYQALQAGRAFISYDLIGDPHGFRFSAQGDDGNFEMGDMVPVRAGVTLQVLVPERARIKIIRHGEVVAQNDENTQALTYNARQPGAYRVEVWREYREKQRCWILSNPIYVTPG